MNQKELVYLLAYVERQSAKVGESWSRSLAMVGMLVFIGSRIRAGKAIRSRHRRGNRSG